MTHDACPLETKDLFISGQGGYHTYRIPAVVTTSAGVVLAFCEGRKKSHGDAGEIHLLLTRSHDGGATWEDCRVVHQEAGDITIGNPCPVYDPGTQTVWLGFTRNNARAFVLHSRDNGETWSSPVEVSDPLRGFDFPWARIAWGPGAGLRMSSGRLVLPCWLNDEISKNYRSAVAYSDDAGETWQPGGVVPQGPGVPEGYPNGSNECAVVETGPGQLYLNSRNLTETRRRIVSRSEDGGLSWSDPVFDPQLQDPRNQGSLLTLPTSPDVSPPTVLLCNAAHETERRNLAVRLSTDGGRSWTGARTIEPGGAEYSSMTLLPDGRIGCLYEHSAEKLFHVTQLRWAQFPLEWLTGNQ